MRLLGVFRTPGGPASFQVIPMLLSSLKPLTDTVHLQKYKNRNQQVVTSKRKPSDVRFTMQAEYSIQSTFGRPAQVYAYRLVGEQPYSCTTLVLVVRCFVRSTSSLLNPSLSPAVQSQSLDPWYPPWLCGFKAHRVAMAPTFGKMTGW